MVGDEAEQTMSTMMQTVFLNGNKSASVVCRQCGRFKSFEADRLRDHGGKMVSVRCACGARFQVFLERRDMYRKPMGIRGWYCLANPNGIKQPMVLENLSHTGVRFSVHRLEQIAIGDCLKVEFMLDENEIRCNVVVRNIIGAQIGAEFVNLEYKAREVIGFTLMV